MNQKMIDKQWAELAREMNHELSLDYVPGEFKDTDGFKAIIRLKQKLAIAKYTLGQIGRGELGCPEDVLAARRSIAEIKNLKL